MAMNPSHLSGLLESCKLEEEEEEKRERSREETVVKNEGQKQRSSDKTSAEVSSSETQFCNKVAEQETTKGAESEKTTKDKKASLEDKKGPLGGTNGHKVIAADDGVTLKSATALPQASTDPDDRTESENRNMNTWLGNMVKVLLEHMNRFGMCVVDDFLGNERGSAVLEEVKLLHTKKMFQDGQVMSGGGLHEPSIRSDKITWTDGRVPCNTPALRHLIKLLDSIVLTANRVPNNKEFGKYRINGRTHIMVACYPGGGTHYVKHVDNPNHDGRVVTAIYYLNKQWNSQLDGGSLQIYSQVNSGAVAKVDPVFDRVIFFWSDARNPHEVLPANRPRFAVTVWYLDEIEKQNYEKKKIMKEDDVSPRKSS